MKYLTISSSYCNKKRMVVRLTKDGHRMRSKTYHIHYAGSGRWTYQKLPPIYEGDSIKVPAVYEYLPSYEC